LTGGLEPTIAAHASQASPTAAITATTAMINGRRDRPARPYRVSRSAGALLAAG
jgi:hypothetical protein